MRNKTKLLLPNTQIVADIESDILPIGDSQGYAIQCDITDNGAGIVASAHLEVQVGRDMLWVTLPNSVTAITTSNSLLWEVEKQGYNHVKVVIDVTSGDFNAIILGSRAGNS